MPPAAREQSTRGAFWIKKFHDNVDRDLRNEAALLNGGWTVLTIWQCEIRNTDELSKKLAAYFGIENH
jgi:DNA mismatch endonuclease, patch repair protein